MKVKHGTLVGRRKASLEDRRAMDRAQYAAHRDRIKEREAARRAAMSPERKAQRKAYYAAWYAANRDRVRANDRLYKYGITREQYEELLLSQGGGCAVCHRAQADVKGRLLHVDHCHTTGRVRGLLCSRCNLAIGQMFDDPSQLRAAAAYLERSA